MRQALVTLALGDYHRALWRRHCAENWQRYADRHGYDVLCIDQPLDTSARARGRTPAWQRLLILDQPFAQRYERIVLVDVDVLINPAAPSVVDGVPVERVGATDEFACPSAEEYPRLLAKLQRYWQLSGSGFIRNDTARDFYAVYDLPPVFDEVARAGVMVLSPRHHRDLLLDVYRNYDFAYKGTGWNHEMRALSYELLKADCVHWLDPRFNYVWLEYKALHFPFLLNRPDHPRAASAATEALQDVHFLHFSGETEQMGLPQLDSLGSSPSRTRAQRPAPRGRHRLETPVVQSEAALASAFERSEQAIVLEDGCRPDPTFFAFCEELLTRHCDDEQVMAITGVDLSSEHHAAPDRYRFTRYPLHGGWATWRRSWELHDPAMGAWPRLRDSGWLDDLLGDRRAAAYWARAFDQAYAGTGGWHAAWTFSCWSHGGLCAAPAVNLVSFATGDDLQLVSVTDPRGAESMFTDMPTQPAEFPLTGPDRLAPDRDYDSFVEDVAFSGNATRLLARIREARSRPRP